MSFIIDRQTISDLGIMSVPHGRAVVSLFGPARTAAGDAKLREMLSSPLGDCARINSRASMIEYFATHGTDFPFEGDWFDSAHAYLSDEDSRQRSSLSAGAGLRGWLARLMNADTGYAAVLAGARAVARIARTSRSFLQNLCSDSSLTGFRTAVPDMLKASEDLCTVFPDGEKWSFSKLVAIDAVLHGPLAQKALMLLDFLGTADACISIAQASLRLGFHRAEVMDDGDDTLEIKGLRHPLLEAAVPNDIQIGARQGNVLFLTGANMAGKSTLMKALGIAVYLAHSGFPVPAESMRISLRDGICTAINLPDDISRGYSHFYSEVRRLKRVAMLVGAGRRMLVIFDELFRGTNVKDAYDGTLEVVRRFASIPSSIFLVSTHIVEVAEALKQSSGNISYRYLPTVMHGSVPHYTYKLEEGVTSDRHGRLIIRNEGLLDILQSK